jgi:hypothetical protein
MLQYAFIVHYFKLVFAPDSEIKHGLRSVGALLNKCKYFLWL